MGKGSVVPSPEGDARRWFVVVLSALRTPERAQKNQSCSRQAHKMRNEAGN